MARRIVVDAMNLIGSRPDGWWNDPDGAMRALATELDEYARTTGEEVALVFDSEPKDVPDTSHIKVVIARRRGRNAADHEIAQMVASDDKPASLTVVTSDRRLVEQVRAAGAKTIGSGTFRERLDRVASEGS